MNFSTSVTSFQVHLTPISNILGPSPSVIFGNKIQKIFLLWRFWWRHTSNIWNLVIISQNSKGYSTYTRNILSTWRHHRQKFALDFVSENDARWRTQFLDFVSEICQYGLNRYLATRDATTLNAIDILTQCNGKVDLALEKLCQNPMPIIPQRMWCEDDTKAFIKGKTQKLH